jgi:SAM-dependent methyltransferase
MEFENERRLKPRIYDNDYCLLNGVVKEMRYFLDHHVGESSTVVDYGCGAKPYQSMFPDSTKYIGVDIGSNPMADIAIDTNQRVPLEDNKADIIISTSVIVHIPEYLDYLNECKRLLKDEGFLFITCPATWTHHPGSGGDYYRFTQDGMKYIMEESGFEIINISPIIGTPATGLHLRQLVLNSWLRKNHLGILASLYNIFTNLRILIEDRITPIGAKLSSPAFFAVIAKA